MILFANLIKNIKLQLRVNNIVSNIENLLPSNLVFWTTKTGDKMKTKTGEYLVFRK